MSGDEMSVIRFLETTSPANDDWVITVKRIFIDFTKGLCFTIEIGHYEQRFCFYA